MSVVDRVGQNYEADSETPEPSTHNLSGWQCPKCKTVYSPWMHICECEVEAG